MLRMVARDSRIAVTTPASEPEIRVMSAASIATSVPVPMARPTSACGQRGGVVDAVADHADPAALGLQAADLAGLVLGQHLGQHPADADLAGDRGGGAGVVAGDHDDVDAEPAQRGDRGGRVVLDGVGDREHAGGLGRRRRPGSGSCPARTARSAIGSQRAGVDAGVGQQPGGADQHRVPVHGGLHALAGDRVEPGRRRDGQAAVAGAGDDRGGERVLAVGLRRGHQRQQLVLVAARRRSRTSVRAGLPAVMVPVLSSTIVSSLCAVSRASAERIRMPAWAPLPVPTMIDSGVARPSAHGQAMISTATAETSASVNAGGGPGDEPDREGGDRDGDDRRARSTPEIASASRWIGALDAWACCTRRMIWASMVSAPTLAARTRSDPVLLMVAPMTVSPARLVDRDRLAGDHRLVHRGLSGQDDGVDRDLLARPDHDLVADDDLLDRDLGLGAVADDPGGAGLQAEQRADGLAGAGLGPGLEQPAEQDQREDDPDGLEVHLAHVGRQQPGRDGDQQAVAVGGGRCRG